MFTKINQFMSKNFIQKFSQIIEKHVEKLIEIELTKVSNYDSTIIINLLIAF